MTIQQAIEKAIEGGFNRAVAGWATEETVLLMPTFWRSLGKAMGWQTEITPSKYDGGWTNVSYSLDDWKHYWHRFIDHLIEGKTPESFFESL